MLERETYPVGVPCWVDTGQPDPAAAVEFYGGLFGWDFDDRLGNGSSYFVAQIDGRDVAGIGSLPEGAPTAWNTYVRVESADVAAEKAKDSGGGVVMEPFDISGAGRMSVLADPEGAAFSVWEAGEFQGAQLVNEPGTWNFSELNARDPEQAKTFYWSLFGWEANGAGEDGAVWRMPGYGDFLAQRDPGIRERQADVGVPAGFEDAVAWLMPAAGADVPPHWSTTFAVDDADAIAVRAAELGATVLVPPMDAPWVRLTVIRDPQGAVFTASKFVPPER